MMRHFLLLMLPSLLVAGCAKPDPCKDEIGAFVMAQEFIKKRLRAPSTADFANITDEGNSSVPTTVAGGRCAFRVRTYVDAENAFGAKLRETYSVVVAPSGDDSWELVSLD